MSLQLSPENIADNLKKHQAFRKSVMEKKCYIQLKNDIDISRYIYNYLNRTFGGKCLNGGYNVPNSFYILNRSLGTMTKGFFNNYISYKIQYSVFQAVPAIGTRIVGKVIKKSPIGILFYEHDAYHQPFNQGTDEIHPAYIMAALKQNHTDMIHELMNLNEGDICLLEIVNARFYPGDNNISLIVKVCHSNS